MVFLAITAAALAVLRPDARFTRLDSLMFGAMGAMAFLLAFTKGVNIWIFGAFHLALGLGVAAFGQRRHERYLINLGLGAFAIEILYIYFRLFGTMMQTSLFFLIGGLLLIALAFAMTRLRRFFKIAPAGQDGAEK